MDPDPSAASRLVLLAYCLFQMLWAKLNVLLLCIAVTVTHLAFLYLTIMVGFFHLLWHKRLQAGRPLIRILYQKFPVEQLVPTYQVLWDALGLGRTCPLGILCLVLNSAQRNAQRLLNELTNELGKALYHAARWTHCGLAIACQNAYQVRLRAVILQLLSTLFQGCPERLWTAISQGIETARAFQFLECSTQQQHGCRSMKEKNEVPTHACLGRRTRVKRRFRRPDPSNLCGHSSTYRIPAPPASTELGNCHFLTPGVPLNIGFHDSKKEMEKKTKKKNEDEKEKKEKNVGKKEKEKKEKKEEEKVEEEKGGEKEVKEEEREKEKIEKEERKEEVKEEVKVEDKKTKKKAEKKTELKEQKEEDKKDVEEEVGKKEEEKEQKAGKKKEKAGGKAKKKEEEKEEAEDKDKAEKKEERKTSVVQQDLAGRMKSLSELISFVYLYALCLFKQ